MLRLALRVTLLGGAFAAATFALGWWTVPVLGAAWALVDRRATAAATTAAAAATLGWGALLAWNATYAGFGLLGRRLSGVLGSPAVLLVVATLLLAAALAWGAAALVGGVLRASSAKAEASG
jgi:hypothetical protein